MNNHGFRLRYRKIDDDGNVYWERVDFPKLKESVDINSLVWRYEEVEINFKDSRTYFLEGERRF